MYLLEFSLACLVEKHRLIVFPEHCRYAPALRQLRQVAFLVTFPPTIPSRLATRLLEVIITFFKKNC